MRGLAPEHRLLLDASDCLSVCRTSSEALLAYARWMADQFDADSFFISEVNGQGVHQATIMYPEVGESVMRKLGPATAEILPTHPFFQRYGANPPPFDVDSIDSMTSLLEFRRTPLYNEMYGQLEIENQLFVTSIIDGSLFAFSANRSTRSGMSDREKQQFASTSRVAVSHIFRTRRQENLFRRLNRLNSSEALIGELGINAAGLIFHADRGAQDLISELLGSSEPLFVFSDEYLRRIKLALGDEIDLGISPSDSRKRIVARVIPGDGLVTYKMLLFRVSIMDESRSDSTSKQSSNERSLLLTPRERETLHWISSGKTNTEIGAIEGVSPRTVAKRAQSIFEKLGVSGRREILLGCGL